MLFIEKVNFYRASVIIIIAKTFKLKKYPCIPEWQQPTVVDKFDYKLREVKELKEDFKYYMPEFPIEVVYKNYNAGD